VLTDFPESSREINPSSNAQVESSVWLGTIDHFAHLTAHPTSLSPFVSRLLMIGEKGLVVLVDEATVGDVARHDLARGPRWASTAKSVAQPPPTEARADAYALVLVGALVLPDLGIRSVDTVGRVAYIWQ
jgi:hypothetical protein